MGRPWGARPAVMEQDDPGEALSELRERRLGALELLQAAAGSGLVAYIAWALLLQPGFRRVPLRLQVRGGAMAGGGVRGRSRTRSEWEALPLPGGPRVGTLKAQEASSARLTSSPQGGIRFGDPAPLASLPRCPMSVQVSGRWSTCCRYCEAVLERRWTWALATAGL